MLDERAMTPICTVYSDASLRYGVFGHCFVIVRAGYEDVTRSGVLLDVDNITACEVASLALGVAFAPPSEVLHAMTDLSCVVDVMSGKGVSYQQKFSAQIEMLREACKKHGNVCFILVDQRTPQYRLCHRESRKAAATKAQRKGISC